MNLADVVARNTRRFRQERGLSLGALAARAEVSKQTVSQLELGRANPTVGTLERLAAALDISTRMLLSEWGTSVVVRRSGEQHSHRIGAGRLVEFDQVYGSGWVQTRALVLYRSDGAWRPEPQARGALHQAFVLAGGVRLGPDREVHELTEGDFIRFPADVPHLVEALTDLARLHLTTTAPQVPQLSTPDGTGTAAAWSERPSRE